MSSLLTTLFNALVIFVLMFGALIQRNEMRAAPSLTQEAIVEYAFEQPSIEEILNSPNPEYFRPQSMDEPFDQVMSGNSLDSLPKVGEHALGEDWRSVSKHVTQWLLSTALELGQRVMTAHSPAHRPVVEQPYFQKESYQNENYQQENHRFKQTRTGKLIIDAQQEPVADLSL